MLTGNFDIDKYNITETFTAKKKANLLSALILLPVYILGTAAYLLLNDYEKIFDTVFRGTFLFEILILALGVFLFVALALIAKAALLSVFAENKFNSVKFKIIKESQKPYCCLTEPIKIRQYQMCIAVYILISAIMPYIIALLMGDFIYVVASFICFLFTGGDIIFLIFLFGRKSDSYVLDFEGIMFYRIYERK